MENLTKDQLAIFQELFDVIDSERDGYITYKELGTVLNSLGGKVSEVEVQGMVNQCDLDGNGSLDFYEFSAMLLNTLCDTNRHDELRDAFKIYEKDNSGFISSAELRSIFILIGLKLSDEEVDELVREADSDQDGVLVFEEFVEMMTTKGS